MVKGQGQWSKVKVKVQGQSSRSKVKGQRPLVHVTEHFLLLLILQFVDKMHVMYTNLALNHWMDQ